MTQHCSKRLPITVQKKLIQQIDTEKFDCYILDIEMDTINGVELATLIRKKRNFSSYCLSNEL